jgi:hypothetical protein
VADEEEQQQGDMRGGSAGEEEEPPVSPEEEELRAQLEDEIRKVRIEDVVLQSAVSILNLSARRIAIDEERDLEQAKVGIDAANALVEHIKPEAQGQLRQAISELQLLYAKHAGEGGAPGDRPPEQPTQQPKEDSDLWTPPGT